MHKLFWLLVGFFFISLTGQAQVSTVEFGKNRVQHKKFTWRYYQTRNFNSYFSQGGLSLGKIVAQVAEEELPQLEEFVEYGLQRTALISLSITASQIYSNPTLASVSTGRTPVE